MSDILCSKIGGIWCYWPGSETIKSLIIVALILLVLLVLRLLEKRFAKKSRHIKHRSIDIKNIHAGKKTKKKS